MITRIYLLICESWPSGLGCSLHELKLLALSVELKAKDLNGVSSKHHWQIEASPQIELPAQMAADDDKMNYI